jgi:SpoVK/Ycf46/Vps4 family AAA+-type ATPase
MPPQTPQAPPEQLAIQLESGHIYKVVRHDDEYLYMERSHNRVEAVGKYKRGDGFAVKVSFRRFNTNFRLMTPQEISQIPMVTEQQREGEKEDGNILYETTERDDFSRLILDQKIVETIMTGVKKIEMREELDRVWGLGDLRPMQGKLALNFYGPPGTGKTASARALARKLDKKILQVDYASMISKWVGDTAKHIRGAFSEAKEKQAMLFFDEADSMLSKRVEHSGQAYEASVNQNRNVLMQELDRFDSIVIFATNFFKNYDEALLRRIAQHIKFELPDRECREKILAMKIPAKARENGKVSEDVDLGEIAKMTKDFSGSDLENVVANAIEFCATNGKEKLAQENLVSELGKIRSSKTAHGAGPKRSLGFGDLSDSVRKEEEKSVEEKEKESIQFA